MNELKTAEQFYQASLENLNKAKELHEATDATSRKTVALFSRFIDGTKSISGDVELAAKDNLKAIQQRDVLAVINSIIAMTLDMPKPYLAYCSVSSSATTSSFYLSVWEPSDKKGTPAALEVSLKLGESSVLEDALSLESQLAEFIIEAKDNAEVTA
ncbi:hypothetical protein [Aliivibrio fischeri]|uniref:hypothetical protein n=1 Tax=Aliivibrio fischeri TaxID=668 RepID=UPI001F4422E5|nr:hypothetical protein [Aliivibrio fischeri]